MNENYSPEYTTPNDATTVVSKRPFVVPKLGSSLDPLTRAQNNLKLGAPLTAEERFALQMYSNQNSTSEIRPQLDGSVQVGMNGSMLEGETPERLWMEFAIGKPLDFVLNPVFKSAANGAKNTLYRTSRYIPGAVGNTIRHGLVSRELSHTLNQPLTRDLVESSVKAALANPTKSGPLGNGLRIENGKIIDSSGLELADITRAPFKINNELYDFSTLT